MPMISKATSKRTRSNGHIITAIDVGTTKTCAATALIDNTDIELLSFAVTQTRGIKKGVIIDIEAVGQCIKTVFQRLQNQYSIDIKDVLLALPADYANLLDSRGILRLRSKEVSETDISEVIESAITAIQHKELQPFHVITKGFTLDGISGIKNPIGMKGSILEVSVSLVTAEPNLLHNLMKCCELAGISVSSVILQPLACAESLLTEQDREEGVVIIDIGGGKTEISVFIDGVLEGFRSIPVGGNHLTNDLMIGLKLPFNEAERIKKLQTINSGLSTIVEVLGIDGQLKGIHLSEIEEIINLRLEELFFLVKRDLEKISKKKPLLSAVLCGGSCHVSGLPHIAETVLNLPVRKGSPIDTISIPNSNESDTTNLRQPEYATLIGLLLFGFERSITEYKVTNKGILFKLLRKLREIF